MKKFCLFLWVINGMLSELYSQVYDGSLIIEGASLFTRLHYLEWNFNQEYVGKETFKTEYACGIYWCGKWAITDDYKIDIRPGLFIAPKIFSSIQLGLSLRREFYNDYFGVLGINLENHGIVLNQSSRTSPIAMTYTLNATVGKKISQYIALLLSIGKTLDNYYGSYFEVSQLKNSEIYSDWILRVGCEWDF